MPFMCLEAWRTENITLFEKRNLRVCGGDSRYDFLTARMPQTHLPILQLLAADHHSYTSSTASLATRPAFRDTQKLSGSTQDYSHSAHSVGLYLLDPLGYVCTVNTVKAQGNSGNPEQELQQLLFY